MNQSSVIAATLLGGFVLFLAANNRLTVYAGVLWGPATTTPLTPSQAAVSNSINGPGSSTVPSLNPIQGTIKAIGSVVGPLIGIGAVAP